jgi:hypothetical protein
MAIVDRHVLHVAVHVADAAVGDRSTRRSSHRDEYAKLTTTLPDFLDGRDGGWSAHGRHQTLT